MTFFGAINPPSEPAASGLEGSEESGPAAHIETDLAEQHSSLGATGQQFSDADGMHSGLAAGGGSLSNSLACRRELSTFSATLLYETPDNLLELAERQFLISSHRKARIGRGAFGYVFKAIDVRSGATVAVKVSRGLNEAQRAALAAEVKLMSALPKHPNVIGFLGLSTSPESGGQVHLVMEYAPCGSVAELYHMHPKLPHSLILKHVREIARGLKHLHDYGIVHRDLKPENILSRADGSIAIADFGCSHIAVNANQVHGAVGTVAYLAPEAASRGEYTPKSDVWAFACTMVVLLTGRLPWKAMLARGPVPAMYHIALRTEGDCEPYPQSVLQTLPVWAEPLVINCFGFSPSLRWNMADVTTFLEGVQ
jgi:serine/threonine protein kinase